MSKWPLTKNVEDFLQKCDIHKENKLEMLCQDHSQLCCTKCVLLQHRECTSVTLISERFQDQPNDLQQLFDKVNTIREELNKLHSFREGSIQSVEVSYTERLQEIREVRQKLNAALDALEKTTLKELDDLRTSLKTQLHTDLENCNKLMEDLNKLSEAVLELCGKNNPDMSFIANRKGMDKIKQSEGFLKENWVKVASTLSFQDNTYIEQYLFKHLVLGKIVQRAQSLTALGNPNQVLNVKQTKEYDIGIPNDSETTSNIIGICVISCDKLIVADGSCQMVNLLDNHYKVISHCDVRVSGDICQISASEVAVTAAEGKTYGIQFISLHSGKLLKGRRLELRHLCDGIAHHDGHLYVTSRSALYKYSLTGELEKKLYEDLSGGITVGQCAVSPTGDKIYVTDYNRHQLLTLSRDGTLLSTFTDHELQNSLGVHVTPAGQVLVCGYSSNTIIQVDEEGKRKLGTIAKQKDGLNGPVSVCSNSATNSVIVGQYYQTKIIVLEV
ncbi:hypothetical protein DPMN_156702 [Dreissena polymorpha]|uniref:B box-type domain-containing protein n=2 Tax=Dreissena polymorpha TaxID=45954 RepID=A0A9D4FPF7_DREPO|nr:hypothetical protein DPMN_156602 [Dreissena polymorpha]KAH3803004.1 hypothetical protein DPMN_156702 [Dreissena polymorpha]